MSDRRNPFEELERMVERMNRQLESAVGSNVPAATTTSVDVVDEGDAFAVTADLPGFEKDEIDVRLDGNRLTITAESDQEEDTSGENYVRHERRHQSVNRSVMLPEDVVEGEVSASYRNGVLTVRLPKRTGGGGTEIDVE
jgi:HSP20 family protein